MTRSAHLMPRGGVEMRHTAALEAQRRKSVHCGLVWLDTPELVAPGLCGLFWLGAICAGVPEQAKDTFCTRAFHVLQNDRIQIQAK